MHLFYFCNNFVKPHYIFIIFGTQILIFNITKLQQNCPPLLMAVLTLPCETSKCSKCFLLALRHALKQFHQWSVAWSVKLCWLLTTFQSDAGSAYWHPSPVSDKYVPAYRFQSVSPGSGAPVWRSCSPGWKWMVLFTVMTCCSNNCCQTSVKLLATFAFQCTTCVQEHWAAATQGWTSHQTCGLPADQISVL